MKIDVESFEAEVLSGMGGALKTMRPTILIEILNDEIAEKIEALVADTEYLYFNLHENGSVEKVEHLRKSAFHNFLFCDEEVAKELGLI